MRTRLDRNTAACVALLGLFATGAAAQEAVSESVLHVRAGNRSIPVHVTGGIEAFGLTPFQLRDLPDGRYVVQVRHGAHSGGVSRLRVRTAGTNRRYDLGSVRTSRLLKSAIVPGLGHLQSRYYLRGGSAFTQAAVAGGLAWNAHRQGANAMDRYVAAQHAYRSERDASQLASRRETMLDAQAEVGTERSERTRWLAAAGWAYGTSLIDLFWDTSPVASLVASPQGTRSLYIRARPAPRGLALLRGALHPGSGHHAFNRPYRGLAFEMMTTASLYVLLHQQTQVETAERGYESALRQYRAADEDGLDTSRSMVLDRHAQWARTRRHRTAALWVTGLTWALNLVDVLWIEPGTQVAGFGVPGRLGTLVDPGTGTVHAVLAARF